MRSLVCLVVWLVMSVVVTACNRATAIPAGSQVVHVTIDEATVVLDPPQAGGGDVYLVLDSPPDGSMTFVERQTAADASREPLSDADLVRLQRGDMALTSTSGLDAGGCDQAQNLEDRGKMGPCGNVMKVVVKPGKYAIIAGAPERDPVTGKTPPIAVLIVTP